MDAPQVHLRCVLVGERLMLHGAHGASDRPALAQLDVARYVACEDGSAGGGSAGLARPEELAKRLDAFFGALLGEREQEQQVPANVHSLEDEWVEVSPPPARPQRPPGSIDPFGGISPLPYRPPGAPDGARYDQIMPDGVPVPGLPPRGPPRPPPVHPDVMPFHGDEPPPPT